MISDFSSVSSHPQTSPSCECKDLQPCPTVAPPCCQHLTLLKDEAFSFTLLIYHFSFQSLGCNSRYFAFLIKYSVWKHVRVFLLMFEVMNMWSCGVQQADNATDGSDFHWVSQTTRPKASRFYEMLPQKIIMSLHTCFSVSTGSVLVSADIKGPIWCSFFSLMLTKHIHFLILSISAASLLKLQFQGSPT